MFDFEGKKEVFIILRMKVVVVLVRIEIVKGRGIYWKYLGCFFGLCDLDVCGERSSYMYKKKYYSLDRSWGYSLVIRDCYDILEVFSF